MWPFAWGLLCFISVAAYSAVQIKYFDKPVSKSYKDRESAPSVTEKQITELIG